MTTEIDAFLAALPDGERAIAEALRQVIVPALPGTLELVDSANGVFGYSRDHTYRRMVCTVAPHGGMVSVVFRDGSSIPVHRAEDAPGTAEAIASAGRATP